MGRVAAPYAVKGWVKVQTFTEYLDRLCVKSYCYPDNFARLARVQELAAARGASVAQVAMAYVVAQPFNVFPLVGCANASEYAANAAALDLALTSDEVRWLERGERD